MRAFGWVLVVLIGMTFVATLAPAAVGLSMMDGVAQLIAIRPWVAAALLVGTLVFALMAGVVRLFTDGRAARLLTLSVIAALVAVGHAGVLFARGVSDDRPPAAATAQPGDVTVVAVNMLGGAADTARVVDVIAGSGADAVMVPEAGDVDEMLRALAVAGLNFTAFDGTSGQPTANARGTALLVRDTMGDYVPAPTSTPGSVRADPADGSGPPLVAVHPIAPPVLPGAIERMRWWREEVADAAELCGQIPGGIVAGDFNATMDHGPMRNLDGCIDAATAAGSGGVGTWPANLPRLLGTPIDHVLADGDAYSVVSSAVVDVSGTDHRAVVARLREG
ncbi:endonuclease/exonuclease/phosphatase family protein [Ruania halotolerans]|uniref:endonuclease/exonuclease/phosphatase family protein n=1 Tax=Ruania halotolerans TaxID=2897773 RepID=UPI001E521F72|nr:endonuclease/exonuclease/phosphatase family protein [Ruania halotolerans]UFU06844.1 endonuclease/exonuclease/phosphatase family protein [Ruania halotolerans]